MQRCGVEEVTAALDSEDVTLLLVLRDSDDEDVARLRELAESRGIPVREGSKTDLWRMARSNEGGGRVVISQSESGRLWRHQKTTAYG
jgi:ribosomal protein L7Ae-like RNA K-turn-binding protein